jgi:hypothetical protein
LRIVTLSASCGKFEPHRAEGRILRVKDFLDIETPLAPGRSRGDFFGKERDTGMAARWLGWS